MAHEEVVEVFVWLLLVVVLVSAAWFAINRPGAVSTNVLVSIKLSLLLGSAVWLLFLHNREIRGLGRSLSSGQSFVENWLILNRLFLTAVMKGKLAPIMVVIAFFVLAMLFLYYGFDSASWQHITMAVFFSVFISNAFMEEILFRGVGHQVLPFSGLELVFASAIVFGLAHAAQGIHSVVIATQFGLVFALLRVMGGSLLALTVLHGVINLAGQQRLWVFERTASNDVTDLLFFSAVLLFLAVALYFFHRSQMKKSHGDYNER